MSAVRLFITNVSKGIHTCRLSSETPSINLRKVLVVTKISRYDLEVRRHPHLSEEHLERYLRSRGSNYDVIKFHHTVHKEFEKLLEHTMRSLGIETKVINGFELTQDYIQWADVICPTGGDGTFLMVASKVAGNIKPVIGFNSDPSRSEGHLCLSKNCSQDILGTLKRLQEGKFNWAFRKRIRITLTGGDEIFEGPVELHQRLAYPRQSIYGCPKEVKPLSSEYTLDATRSKRILPVLALNEVFIGENLAARVSYIEMRINGGPSTRVKSSGLCVSTGTGSTSWHMSINRITKATVHRVASLLNSNTDPKVIAEVAKAYNKGLIFAADDHRMCYTIRELISVGVWPQPKGIATRSFATQLELKSCCYDAGLIVDGGVSFAFNDGTVADLEINDCDSLRTVQME